MSDTVIQVKNLSKAYKLYAQPMDRIKEAVSLTRKQYHQNFYAVNNLSFEVKRGETLGIIGKNGSGKSTLLKMLTGVLSPSSGSISLQGRVSALLELGAGFNGELSGMDNIRLNGTLLGYTKQYIDQIHDEILDFADIGDFIHQPVKTYSSGMFVRLAFAVAINVKPEIFIVDEALSVGDMRFQQKCYRKIKEIKEHGTVLLVSHDMGALTNFCDRIIWLHDGKIYKEGAPEPILEDYQAFMSYGVEEMITEPAGGMWADGDEKEGRTKSFGSRRAVFETVRILDAKNKTSLTWVSSGQEILIDMHIKVFEAVADPILGFNVKDAIGNMIIVSNTFFENARMEDLKPGQAVNYKWKFKVPHLRSGQYALDIALASGTYEAHEQIQWINDAIVLYINNPRPYQHGRGWYVPVDVELIKP